MRTIHQTTITGTTPGRVIRTTKVSEPELVETNPEGVYEKKKTLFRASQIVWYILGIVEFLISLRVLLKLIGANPFSGFAAFIYGVTTPLTLPFQGIVGSSFNNNYILEWSSLIAVFVYACVAWGLVYFLDLIYPITPKDVEVE